MKNAARTVLRGAIGAAIGAAAGGAAWGLVVGVPLAPADALDRCRDVAPAILACLAALGATAGAAGRALAAWADDAILPREATPAARRLYRLAGLIVGLAVVQYHVIAFLFQDPTDLPSFVLAARAMAAGRDFYDPEVLRGFFDDSTTGRTVFPYLYPPLYAVLFRPVAGLPLAAVHAVVLVGNAVLWPVLFVLCFRLVAPEERIRPALAALALVVFPGFLPTVQTLHHGSPSLLVAVLVVGVLVCAREGRDRLGGALLGAAVLVKIVPVLLVPYLLLRGRRRLVLWAAGATAALLVPSLIVAGPGAHLHWLWSLAPDLALGARTGTFFEPGCHPENQALTGIFCRFLGADGTAYRVWASVAGAAAVLVTGVALWRRREPAVDRLEGSLVAVTLLLVSTITWFHHLTLMLLPLLALVAVGAAGVEGSRGARVVLAVGAASLVAVGFEYYLDPWPFLGPNPLTRIARFYAMAACWVTLVVLVWRGGCGRRDTHASGGQAG